MECKSCKNVITPGMEIVIDELSREWVRCPYCLQPLKPETTSPGNGKEGADIREKMRRDVREKFVGRLVRQSLDGKLQCPVCSHDLNKNDEHQLIEEEHFKCPLCRHDLATYAYREVSYHEQRWLPVAYALLNVLEEKKCADCCYAGAIAKACQKAFSWMPGTDSSPNDELNKILRHFKWEEPACDWESCVAVKQYRKLAGEGLLLL